MSEPRRILEDEQSGAGRDLLESAAGDGPSAQARSRAFSAMMTAASEPLPPASTGWRLPAGKVVALGIVLAVAGAALFLRVSSRSKSRPLAIASSPMPKGTSEPARAPLEHLVVPSVPARTEGPAEDGLGVEVRLLDQVRSALARHDTHRAERTLDHYRERFPNGRLNEESISLRVQTLLAQDRKPEARALAMRFLTEHPHSPLVRRVRALLSQCEAPE